MDNKIEITVVHGLFGGDSLESNDGSYYDHKVWCSKLRAAIQKQYPDARISVSVSTNKSSSTIALGVDGMPDSKIEQNIESIESDLYTEICNDTANWHTPSENE